MYVQEDRKYELIAKESRSAPSVGGSAHILSGIALIAVGIGIVASLVISLIVSYNTGNANLAGYTFVVGSGISYTVTYTILLKVFNPPAKRGA